MGEGNQLIKALEQQAKIMNIDNRDTVAVIERLINDIGESLFVNYYSNLNLVN